MISRFSKLLRSSSRVTYLSTDCNSNKEIKKLKNIYADNMQPVSKSEIIQFLNRLKLGYVEANSCLMTSCIRHCRNKIKLDKLEKLYINTTTGYFLCLSCMKSGSWNSFTDNSLKLEALVNSKKRLTQCFDEISDIEDVLKSPDILQAQKIYQDSFTLDKCDKDKLDILLIDLKIQNLSYETLMAYDVRISTDHTSLLLPLYSFKKYIVAVKFFTLATKSSENELPKINSKIIPRRDVCGLFGLHLLDSIKTSEIILTCNEFDAMAVYQETLPNNSIPSNIDFDNDPIITTDNKHTNKITINEPTTSPDNITSSSNLIDIDTSINNTNRNNTDTNNRINNNKNINSNVNNNNIININKLNQNRLIAISLPKGDNNLSQKVLPLLESVKKITVWFGGENKKWTNARHLAAKLNSKRCYLIRPDSQNPTALSCLEKGLDMRKLLDSAHPIEHSSIVTFKDLRKDLYNELADAELMTGVKWQRYPILNQLLKGHRRGELTVFTGPTGSGKTTFISDYSLDLAMQGVNTLWGSFEINNVRLVKTMLNQFAQLNLAKNLDQFDTFADKFETLPMYFMTFHGQENIKKVIETMSHAVYVHDIAHVIVDNLQFMLGLDENCTRQSLDRYLRQDQVISSFRKFATHMNCHITLVIHPRKEKDAEDLTVSSIFGSAKVSQEADNIMILQDRRLTSIKGKKFIQVAKNRFDGELGVMLLRFDKESLSFSTKISGKTSTAKLNTKDANSDIEDL